MIYVLIGGMVGAIIIFLLSTAKDRKLRAHNWGSYPGDDTKVIGTAPDGSKVTIDLPEGKTIDDVKAVYVGKRTKNAKVRTLHEQTNRRGTDGSTDHDMSL